MTKPTSGGDTWCSDRTELATSGSADRPGDGFALWQRYRGARRRAGANVSRRLRWSRSSKARRMTVPIMGRAPIGTTRRALQEVSIRARVRGFLKEISFAEGADVKAGQLLFVIDEEPFQAKVAEARSECWTRPRSQPEEGAYLGLQGAGRSRRHSSRSPRRRSSSREVEERRETGAVQPQRHLDRGRPESKRARCGSGTRPRSRPPRRATSRRRPTTTRTS